MIARPDPGVLDLGALEKCIASLDEAWLVWTDKQLIDQLAPAVVQTIRAGVIQNFEFSYEVCWKFMKRWLAYNVSPECVEGTSRQQLFRLAAQHHLIDDYHTWMRFHRYRNLSAHTYDAELASEVSQVAGELLADARILFSRLASRND